MMAAKKNNYDADLEMERTLIQYVRDIWKAAPDTRISARMLADKMEMNIASIYGIFDSLDELYYYASVYFLENYARELPKRIAHISNPLVCYMEMSRCFCENAFRYPRAYQTVFDNRYAGKHNRMLSYYRELFPGELDAQMNRYMPQIMGNDLHTRDVEILRQAAKAKLIPAEAVIFIASANTILIRSVVDRVLEGEMAEIDFSEKVKMVTSAQAHLLLGYCLNMEEAEASLTQYLTIPDPAVFGPQRKR